MNDWLGRVIGVLTLTPYDSWRRTRAAHHASSGNLDRRGNADQTIRVRQARGFLVADDRSHSLWISRRDPFRA